MSDTAVLAEPSSPLSVAVRGTVLQQSLAATVCFLSLFLATFILYSSLFGSTTAFLQRMLFAFVMLSLALLVKSPLARPWHHRGAVGLVPDLIAISLLFAGLMHVFGDVNGFTGRLGSPSDADLFFGVVYIVATLEATRRTLGWPIVIIVSVFLVQALFGSYLPDPIRAPSVRWQTLVEILFMEDQGLFGPTTAVAVSYLMLFLMFGALLTKTNAVQFFEKLSLALLGRRPGGPAHVAVMSSALLGTASGSVVGNVAGSGAFTIPLMIRSGFKRHFAGGVEAAASSGAQIMPPIMGSAAFLMAAFLGVSYWSIVVAAIVPAALYFISLFIQVELRARKEGMAAYSGELPKLGAVMLSQGHLLIAIGALIVPFFFGQSAQRAGLIGLGTLFVLSLLKRETRISGGRYLEGVVDAFVSNVAVGVAVIAAGVLVGTVWVSGAGSMLAHLVVDISQGVLPVALILTAIIALILGMGLPTPAVYLTLAVLIVPALVRMGAPELNSHMFAFYFGILANVTPPVALAAYAAASIAGGDLNRTGFAAFKLALAGFLIPFAMIYSNGLMLQGTPVEVAIEISTALLGVFVLAVAVEGWLVRPLGAFERLAGLVGAVLLIFPHDIASGIGLLIAGAIVIPKFIGTRSRRGASSLEETK